MPKSTTDELSDREREILRFIATGASNKEIAQKLFISSNTVKVHLRNIFAKIGVASRTEAAMYAVRLGIAESSAVVETVDEELASGKVETEARTGETPIEMALSPGQNLPVEAPAVSLPTAAPSQPRPRLRWALGGGILLAMVLLAAGWAANRDFFTGLAGSLPWAPTPTPVPSGPRWDRLQDLPTARQGLAVVALDGDLFAIGGEQNGRVSGLIERYRPADRTWDSLAAKPLAVADMQAAAVDGMIIVPGGRTAGGQPTTKVEVFDLRLNQWSQAAPLPAARSAYALAEWEGRLYLFGGWDGAQFTNTVFRYDFGANLWSELTPMPTARGFQGAVAAAGNIFVFGGWDGAHALDVTEVYQPAQEKSPNGPWSKGKNLPAPRYAFGYAGIASFIYALGGIGANQTEPPPAQYNVQDGQWVTFSAPETGLGGHIGIAALNTDLHVMGNGPAHYSYQAVKIVVIPLILP